MSEERPTVPRKYVWFSLFGAVVFLLQGLDRVLAGPGDRGTFVLGVVALAASLGFAGCAIAMVVKRRRTAGR